MTSEIQNIQIRRELILTPAITENQQRTLDLVEKAIELIEWYQNYEIKEREWERCTIWESTVLFIILTVEAIFSFQNPFNKGSLWYAHPLDFKDRWVYQRLT